MAGRRVPVEEKVGAWAMAFNAVAAELTPRRLREQAGGAEPEIRRIVAANDRTAALVAALLIGAGAVRPIQIEEDVP